MSIDHLQSRIRKLKNPSIVSMDVALSMIPPHILEQESSHTMALERFVRELLEALKDKVPAVYFDFDAYALGGPEHLELLKRNLRYASELGYYVLLQYAGVVTGREAERAAGMLMNEESLWYFDGLAITGMIGQEGVAPFVEGLDRTDRDLFVFIRTGNKSAAAVQDLMTGGRMSHMATADLISRMGKNYVGKYGYSRLCGVGPATSADTLNNLRTKYKDMFLLIHGYDNPAANAKNCAAAFDRLGYGAAALSDFQVSAAWFYDENSDGQTYLELAVEAAERMKKNITRYITIL